MSLAREFQSMLAPPRPRKGAAVAEFNERYGYSFAQPDNSTLCMMASLAVLKGRADLAVRLLAGKQH